MPPQRTGVAGYALAQARALAELTAVRIFTGDPTDATAAAVDAPAVSGIGELDEAVEAGDVDVVIYHVGNSVENLAAVETAATGPPGVVVLHDGTLHHLLEAVAGSSPDYEAHLRLAHGPGGEQIAAAHRGGSSGEIERALFDGLSPVLRRHRLVIVHSRWLAALVRRRVPEVPVRVIPLAASAELAPATVGASDAVRTELGIPGDAPVLGLVGFVNRAKRPDLVVAVFERLLERFVDAHLVLVGDDQSDGFLAEVLDRHRAVRDRVTLTGYLDADRFAAAVTAIDVVIAVRSPHLGESSAALATAMALGRPVVSQATGSYGELPADIVAFHRPGGDEVAGLATLVGDLLDDPDERRRRGRAGQTFAAGQLGGPEAAALLLGAVSELEPGPRSDPGPGGPVFGAVPTAPAPRARRRRGGWMLGRDGSVHPLHGAPYHGCRIDPDDPAFALIAHEGSTGAGYTVVRASGAESFGPGRPREVSAAARGAARDALPADEVWLDVVSDPDGGTVALSETGFLYDASRPGRRRHSGIADPVGLGLMRCGVVVVGARGDVVDDAGAPVEPAITPVLGSVVATMQPPAGPGLVVVTDAGRTYTVEGEPSGLGLSFRPRSPVVAAAWAGRDP